MDSYNKFLKIKMWQDPNNWYCNFSELQPIFYHPSPFVWNFSPIEVNYEQNYLSFPNTSYFQEAMQIFESYNLP